MNTPRYGNRMMKTHHPAFAQPDVSCRRNRSEKTTISSQIQMIQAKKMNIVQMTCQNVSASTMCRASLVGIHRESDRARRAGSSSRVDDGERPAGGGGLRQPAFGSSL